MLPDGTGYAGAWEEDARGVVRPAGPDSDEWDVADCIHPNDAALIVAYRADALALADEVERLQGLLDVPYRPGLPTMEQVQAHESRGGVWMWRGPEWDANEPSEFARPGHRGGNRCLAPEGRTDLPWIAEWTSALWRPCFPDGTTCPWIDR